MNWAPGLWSSNKRLPRPAAPSCPLNASVRATMKRSMKRRVSSLASACLLFALALPASSADTTETYTLLVYSEPGAILFPTRPGGSPRSGVMPLDSVRFATRCSLRGVLGSMGVVGVEKLVWKHPEGDTLDACTRWVYDEPCTRAYVLHVSPAPGSSSESPASARATLLASGCIDSVAGPEDPYLRRQRQAPVLLTPVEHLLPDSTTTGLIMLSLRITPWGSVSHAAIAASDLPDSSSLAVLKAAWTFSFHPSREGCARKPDSLLLPIMFGDVR